MLHHTLDVIEESHGLTLVVEHIHVLNDMTSTVVMTFKTVGTGSDGNHQRVLHINVGGLPDIEITASHQSDGYNKILQIYGGSYLIGLFLGTFA